MNRYYSPTSGSSQSSRGPGRKDLNSDIRKLIEERQEWAEKVKINQLATDRMQKDPAQLLGDAQALREVETELAIANTPEDEQVSFLGRIGDILELPSKHVARPLMAGTLANIFRILPGEQAGEAELRKATGWNPLGILTEGRRERMREALEETKLPFGVYTAMEMALDPLSYVPLGVVGKMARAGTKVDEALATARKVKEAQAAVDAAKISKIGLRKAQKELRIAKKAERKLTTAQKIVEKVTKAPGVKQSMAAVPDVGAATGTTSAELTTTLGRLRSHKERIDQTLTPTHARRIAEGAAKYPIFRELVGAVNATVLATTNVGKMLLGHSVLIADGEKFAAIGAARIQAIRATAPRIVNGMVQLGDNTSAAWDDLFEELPAQISARVKKKQLTQEQADYIAEYRLIMEDASKMLEEAGFKNLRDELVEAGAKGYIPRFAKGGQESIESFRRKGQEVGKKMSWEHKRYYDTMLEGLENGIQYLDPEQLMAQHLRGAYRVIAERQLLARVKEIPGAVLTRTLAPVARAAVIRASAKLTTGKKLVNTVESLQKSDDLTVAGKDILDIEKALKAGGEIDGDSEILGYLNELKNVLKGAKGPIQETDVLTLNKRKRSLLNDLSKKLNTNTAAKGQDPNDFIGVLTSANKAAAADLKKGIQEAGEARGLGYIVDSGGKVIGKSHVFDKETRDAFAKLGASSTAPRIFKMMATGNIWARLGATGFDFGAGFLQGLPLLATNPRAWARAQKHAIESLFDPTAYARYIKKHERTLREMGIDLKANEFVEAWGDPLLGSARATMRKFGPVGKGIEKGTDAASRAFTGLTLAARVEMYEALRPVAMRAATKKGMDISDPRILSNVLEELSEHVGKMTGFSSNAKLGITSSRADIERALFFAPRYLRATTGAVADVFQGGIRGTLAKTTLAKMAAGGSLMYFGLATALGQEPQFDPTKRGFMEVEINGTKFGFGSAWIGLARTVGSVASGPLGEGPIDPDIEDPEESFLGALIDPKKHVLGYYLRSKASPILGLGWDITLGKDFHGDEVNPLADPGEFAIDDLAGATLPFWMQTFISDEGNIDPNQSLSSKALQAGAELTGLRSSPISFFQQLEDRRDLLAKTTFEGKSWDQLNTLQKDYLNNNDNILKEMKVQVQTHNLESTDAVQRAQAEYKRDKDEFTERKNGLITDATSKWETGNTDGFDWRMNLKSSMQQYRNSMRDLEKRADYLVARSANKEYYKLNKSGIALDEAYSEYIDQIVIGVADDEGRTLYDAYGDLDYRLKEQRLDAFKAEWDDVDPSIFRDILNHFEDRNKDKDPILQRYYQGNEEFEFYWKLEDDLVANNSALIPSEVWDRYRENKGNSTADALEEEYPIIKQILKLSRSTKERMRELSPALDAYLYQFRYTSSLKNKTTLTMGKKMIEDVNFDPFTLPMN